MHNIKLTNIIIIILYTCVILWIASILLGYTPLFFKLLVIALAVVPFVFTNIIKSRDYWLIIGLGSTMYVSKIPLPILDALNAGYIINAILIALIFAELAMKKLVLPRIFDTFPNRCMAFFALVVTARVIIDRPGSGAMGGTGGLSSALPTLLAGWCFFSTLVLAKQWIINKKQIAILYLMAFVGLIHVIYKNVTLFIPRGHFVSIFPYPSVWILSFLPLSKLMSRNEKDNNIKLSTQTIILTVGIIILSVISKNRAALLYAATALLIIHWCYKKINRYIVILALGILMLTTITSLFPSIVPRSAVRTLSLISTQVKNRSKSDDYGEMGWHSDWRTTLARIAWEDIRRHPLTGKGFSFSFEELQYNALIANSGDAARFGGLLSSGGYHNSLLFLAVKVGIPATLAFLFALINIYWRFLAFSQKRENDELKQFCAGLSAIFMCALAKMLTNGGPLDVFTISIMIATMQGILTSNNRNSVQELN